MAQSWPWGCQITDKKILTLLLQLMLPPLLLTIPLQPPAAGTTTTTTANINVLTTIKTKILQNIKYYCCYKILIQYCELLWAWPGINDCTNKKGMKQLHRSMGV